LIKLLVDEPSAGVADEFWDEADTVVASRLVYPEARAALAAARRAERLAARGLRRAVSDLELFYAALTLIELDGALAQHAGDLAERHQLRGYDAVHLASALSVGDENLVLVSWDCDLAAAAVMAGLNAAPR
jgi:predicted nucleic acid-binding protein